MTKIHPGISIKHMAESYHIPQSYIVKKSGISKSHISLILNGKKDITIQSVLRIKKAFPIYSGFDEEKLLIQQVIYSLKEYRRNKTTDI